MGPFSLVIAPKGPRYGRRLVQRRWQRARLVLGIGAAVLLLLWWILYRREAPAAVLESVWSIHTSGPILAAPRIDGDWIYVGSADGSIRCMEFSSGREVWRKLTGLGAIRAKPITTEGRVIVASEDGRLSCLSAHDGSVLWERQLEGSVACDLLLVHQTVFIGGDDEFLYAVDAKTGEFRWPPIPVGAPVSSGPEWIEPYVVCGTAQGTLFLFDPRRYEIRRLQVGSPIYSWPVSLASSGQLSATLRSSGATSLRSTSPPQLAVGTDDGYLRVLDLSRGEEVVAIKTQDSVRSRPLIHSGLTFFGSNDGWLYSADLAAGRIYWKVKTQGSVRLAPLMLPSGELIFASDDGFLRTVDTRTGRVLNEIGVGAPISGLEARDDVVVLGSWDGLLRCVRISPRP